MGKPGPKQPEPLKQAHFRAPVAVLERLEAEAARQRRATGKAIKVSLIIRAYVLAGLERDEAAARESSPSKPHKADPEPAHRKLAATGT